ncbi:putative DNA packaging protein [Nitrincola phage 1M3-16]|uniref:putative DNA packaging protein n=1 Tax=Nitrincola phage 1M3-16 TaxID=1472912 RepID=UPI000444C25D|nr:putative DNA packaging protein [Nitrincola phage 1M3-16]AHX01069.1 putative DNA packaging protein [Nitrincola phage 1M3-16]
MCANLKRAVERHKVTKMMLIAPTQRDIRANIFPQLVAMYPEGHPNMPQLKISTILWPKTGAECVLVPSSAGPDAVRGYNNEMLIGDEVCFWENEEEILTQAMLTLRSSPAICMLATTPKATPNLLNILNDYNSGDKSIHIVRGKTSDNAANLNETFLKTMYSKYEGTALGKTELEGELILTNPDALVQRADIDRNMCSREDMPQFEEIGIGLDIALISDKNSIGKAKHGRKPDSTGIVVSGVDEHGVIYTLDNFSGRYTPQDWARKVATLYDQYVLTGHRVKVYIESNQGGRELIENAFDNVGRSDVGRIAKYVFSKTNKMQRLLPYALMIEQGKIKFNKDGKDLEQLYLELTSYTGKSGQKSPDTLDAAVFSWSLISPIKKSYSREFELLF